MMRSVLSATLLACAAVFPVTAVAEATCDQAWMVVTNTSFKPAKARDGSTTEESYRYRTGAEAFAKGNDMLDGLSPAELEALPKGTRMEALIGLQMGDRLMACYEEAAATVGDGAYVKATNGTFPSGKRAEIIAKYKLAD